MLLGRFSISLHYADQITSIPGTSCSLTAPPSLAVWPFLRILIHNRIMGLVKVGVPFKHYRLLPILKYQEQLLHPVFRCSVSIPVHLGGEVQASMPYDHLHEDKPLGYRYLPLVEYCPCCYGECAATILASDLMSPSFVLPYLMV